MIEVLVVIPKEEIYYKTGLHPERRRECKAELRDQFIKVLEVLKTNPDLVNSEQSLRVLGNWIEYCRIKDFQSSLPRLRPFVDSIIVALQEAISSFNHGINFVNELMRSIKRY